MLVGQPVRGFESEDKQLVFYIVSNKEQAQDRARGGYSNRLGK